MVALLLAGAALSQARTAALRHNAQTDADRQRHITESFSKAVEQLGSEKMEARLGGIYTLERISHESAAESERSAAQRNPPPATHPAALHPQAGEPGKATVGDTNGARAGSADGAANGVGADLYWTVMETLTAFVREHARWKEPDAIASETMARFYEDTAGTQSNHEPATDIAAVLSVIVRRSDKNRAREKTGNWRFNLRGTDLRRALLRGAHLEKADLGEAHLEKANLRKAHLKNAYLREAHLTEAELRKAHLKEAYLRGAHLKEAYLIKTCLEVATLVGANLEGAYLLGANLNGASLDGANLRDAHLEGTDLSETEGLTHDQLALAHADARTILPQGVTRPAGWPPAQ